MKYDRLLEVRGVSLASLGIQDIGLSRDDALLAVDALEEVGIGILGGDVYWLRANSIELAYANWHAEPRPGEPAATFAARSALTAREYLQRFPEQAGSVPLFSFVVKSWAAGIDGTLDVV